MIKNRFTVAMQEEYSGRASQTAHTIPNWVESVDFPLGDLAITISQFSEYMHRRWTFKTFRDFQLDACQNPKAIQHTSLGIYGGETTDLILLEERASCRQKPPAVMRSIGRGSDIPVPCDSADTYQVDADGQGIFEDAKSNSLGNAITMQSHLAISVKSPPPEPQRRESIQTSTTSTNSEDMWRPVRVQGGHQVRIHSS